MFKVGKVTIEFIQDDITNVEADAIVNAANSSLLGGLGVDGAIHSKGGPRILEECKQIRAKTYPDGLPTGQAVITTAGNLKAKKIIHAVGPIWQGGKHKEDELLSQAYSNSLKLAVSKSLKTVAFPSISTGAYGYPIEKASHIAIKSVKDFLETIDNLEKIIFVLFSLRDLTIYLNTANQVLC